MRLQVVPHKSWRTFSTFSVIFAFAVMALGAYTRLTDAGLGCPDWPGCYGHWLVPDWRNLDPDNAAVLAKTVTQAWTEMAHRYLAGALGLVCVMVCIGTFRRGKDQIWGAILVAAVCAQAYLGQATVSWKLHPVIVLLHLLGGTLILSLLLWIRMNMCLERALAPDPRRDNKIRFMVYLGLPLLAVQLLLGGWTSANYAGLVCPGFPLCFMEDPQPIGAPLLQAFSPPAWEGFSGQPTKTYTERVTIQMVHRYMALVVGLWLLHLAVVMIQNCSHVLKKLAFALGILLITQITLGAINAIFALPLWSAVLHHHVAIALWAVLLAIAHRLYTAA